MEFKASQKQKQCKHPTQIKSIKSISDRISLQSFQVLKCNTWPGNEASNCCELAESSTTLSQPAYSPTRLLLVVDSEMEPGFETVELKILTCSALRYQWHHVASNCSDEMSPRASYGYQHLLLPPYPSFVDETETRV